MTIRIGSNISALRAIRFLDGSQDSLARTFERLSSGARINRASDDPAGLSVSSRLSNKARVLGRAQLNVSDAVSMLTIADSTLSEVGTMLSRMAELAEQAANGTFSSSQRGNLYAEYNAMEREIRRLGESVSFNGINPLRGGRSSRAVETLIDAPELGVSVDDASGDGRFVSVTMTEGGNTVHKIRDTVTGREQTIDVGTIDYVKVLANGDAIVGSYNNNISDYYRVSFDSGQSTLIARMSQSALDSGKLQIFSVSADGESLLFTSRYQYQDGQLGTDSATYAGTFSFYRLDLSTNRISTIAGTTFNSLDTSRLSANGRYAAIHDGSAYRLYDLQNPSQSPVITSITSSANIAGLSNSGELLFTSTSDLVGSNPNLRRQFFSIQAGTGAIRQLSSFTSTYTLSSLTASFDGSMIFFRSTNNITGENAGSANQIFAFDVLSASVTQRTSGNIGAVTASSIFITADGSRIFGRDSTQQYLYSVDVTPGSASQDFEVGFGASGRILADLDSLYSAVRGLGGSIITSQLAARAALDRVKDNISALSQLRGKIGAAQSRVAIAGSLLASQREEITAGSARIKDVDIAAESAQLVRQQILQQVGAAVLAQATQQPALAIRLLR